MVLFQPPVHVVFLADFGSEIVAQIVSPVSRQCFCMFVHCLNFVHSVAFDEFRSFVFIICKLPPLVEPVQLELPALRPVLLEEGGFGPLVSEVLISGDGVVLLLFKWDSFHTWLLCEASL